MKKVLLLVVAAAALAVAVPAAFAKGGDDGPGDDRGKDTPAQVKGHGADDPAGHDAGDDKGGSKRADDPAGHDANDDRSKAHSSSSATSKKSKARTKARNGICTIRSTSKLKANPPRNGRIEVEFEVESHVSGQVWNVLLTDNGSSFFTGKAATKAPGGSFEVRAFAKNQAGTDSVWASATNPTSGETCNARVSV